MLLWSWAEERLAAARNYWIVTGSGARGPHATPVWGLWDGGGVVFSCGHGSRKARNLEADPRLVVHLESGDDVVIVEGEAERIEPDEALLAAYADKYQPVDPEIGNWYRVRTRRVLAWQEASYPGNATRFDFP